MEATGFHFFSFTPFGLPILAAGILYMLVARRWLSAGAEREDAWRAARPSLGDWVAEYRLAGREQRVQVRPGSSLAGKTLAEIRDQDDSGAVLVALERYGKLIQSTGDTQIRVGDTLFLDLSAPEADIEALRRQYDFEPLPISGAYFTDQSQQIGMAEVIISPTADFLGKTANEADFRNRYGLTVIGLRRRSEIFERGLRDEELLPGDTLLMIGPWAAIRRLRSETRGLVVLNFPAELDELLPAAGKAPLAVVCLLLAVGLMISGVIPNVQAALIGCLLMGLLGCVDLTSAYRSIDWKTLVLIVGMLPFSIALDRTGGVEMAADGLVALVGEAGPRAVLATLFAITAALGMFISNTATAVLMAPVAISLADDFQASPYPFAMIVALAASTAFMTPVSSPVNTLVVTPGNYTFGDFVKIGVPFSILVLILSILLVPWLLPL